MSKIDKNILNLTAILISGAGLFVVLTKFNVPELNSSFWDVNPFAIKKGIIENVINWIFTLLALVGFLLRSYFEIAEDKIPKRLYTLKFYLRFFFTGIIVMVFVVIGFTKISYVIAKFKWQPIIVESQKDLFQKACNILKNDGWRDEQLSIKDTIDDPERFKNANWEQTENDLSQIEKLLDIQINKKETLIERIRKLKKYFNS